MHIITALFFHRPFHDCLSSFLPVYLLSARFIVCRVDWDFTAFSTQIRLYRALFVGFCFNRFAFFAYDVQQYMKSSVSILYFTPFLLQDISAFMYFA